MGKNNKIEEIFEFILRNYKDYRRYYVPTSNAGEISNVHDLCNYEVKIDVSFYGQYIDILGLTQEEQKELENKLAKKRVKTCKKNTKS